MAHRWNRTKKKTVLRIGLGSDQGRSRCLVALSERWKLALISRSVSSHRRAGNKTQNSSAALQTIVFPRTRPSDKRSHRHAGNKNPERCRQTIESAAGSGFSRTSDEGGPFPARSERESPGKPGAPTLLAARDHRKCGRARIRDRSQRPRIPTPTA